MSHEVAVTLDDEYDAFMYDVDKRIDVANRITKYFGDKDTSKFTVTSIKKGSVIYSWTNNSLPSNPCPADAVRDLMTRLITVDNNINESFAASLKPHKVKQLTVVPMGECISYPIPIKKASLAADKQPGAEVTAAPKRDKDGKPVTKPDMEIEVVPNPDMDRKTTLDPIKEKEPDRVEKSKDDSDADLLLMIVVPLAIIAAMLLLAGIIACILYKRRRKDKLHDEVHNTSFINKGIPIIFADELEDKPDPPTKPLIMADEKPPLPPPEYSRSAAGSMPSTPLSDHKDPITEDDEQDSDLMSPLYQPPPPFTGSRDSRHNRPKHQQQSYHHPPPYVPP